MLRMIFSCTKRFRPKATSFLQTGHLFPGDKTPFRVSHMKQLRQIFLDLPCWTVAMAEALDDRLTQQVVLANDNPFVRT